MQFLAFLNSNARWLAGGFLLTFFSSFGQTFFIALSGGQIRAEYGLTNGQWGMLYMLATLGSALSLPFIGRLVDVVSVSRTVLVVAPMLALACMMMGFSGSIVLLAVTLYLLRLFGQGMMTHTALTAMGRWYAAQRGKAVSVAVIGHQAGEALLPITFFYVAILVGWRNTWFLSALILLAVALPAIYGLMRIERVPGSGELAPTKTAPKDWSRGEVLKDAYFWLLLIAVLAPSFIGTTLFFHQAYHVELRGWDPVVFASTFTLMAGLTFVFALITGQLIDRYSALTLLPTFLLPLALACLVAWAGTSQWTAFLFMGLTGVSYGISSTLFGALWPEVYGTRHLGAVRSVIIAFMVFGTALGPGLTGALIDLGVAYPLQILFMGIYCVAASALMVLVSRRINHRLAEARKLQSTVA